MDAAQARQVLLCHGKGFGIPEISYAVKISQRLVQDYLTLIQELATGNRALEALLQEAPLRCPPDTQRTPTL